MPPESYIDPLRELVKTGRLPMSVVDSRVRDVLRVKFWLGLFDQPYVSKPAEADGIEEGHEWSWPTTQPSSRPIAVLTGTSR